MYLTLTLRGYSAPARDGVPPNGNTYKEVFIMKRVVIKEVDGIESATAYYEQGETFVSIMCAALKAKKG
jgi:hypothetical protein